MVDFFLLAGSIKGEVIARDDVCAKGNRTSRISAMKRVARMAWQS